MHATMKLTTSKSNRRRRWEGYNLEELRCQRALAQARIMIEQHRLNRDVASLRESITKRDPSSRSTMIGRMLGALSYMDWILLGIGAYRRLAPLLRKRK